MRSSWALPSDPSSRLYKAYCMDEVFQVAIIFVVAFAVTFAMVPVSKRIAVKIGAIDYPSNRRLNVGPMPRCGGIALYVGFLSGFAVVFLGERFFGWNVVDLYLIPDINYLLLFVGVTFMFTVGLIDDIMQLSALAKLCGQIAAAIIVVISGVSIGMLQTVSESSYIDLGWFNYPLTVIYLVIFVNAINLIDGLDGLAAGIVAIFSLSLLFLVLQRGNFSLVAVCVILVAICAAFLRFNFFPASIFMGDSGSLLLGLLIGIVSIAGVIRTQSLVVLLVPFVISGVPLLDVLSAIVRRRRIKRPIQEGDLEHIHHRLLKSGLSQRRSVALLYFCSVILAVCGVMIGYFSGIVQWVVLFALAIAVFFVIWKFGLFKPVLKHYYDNKGRRGPRGPRS